jgi:hypothetical protein
MGIRQFPSAARYLTIAVIVDGPTNAAPPADFVNDLGGKRTWPSKRRSAADLRVANNVNVADNKQGLKLPVG